MRTIKTALAALALASTASAAPQATFGTFQFEKMRSLLGEWTSVNENGTPILAWYKLISGGTTLMETFKVGDEPEMVSLYHLDHDDLLMTHYCSVNNQPRMRAEPPGKEQKIISFAFVSATNLTSPDAGHMHALTVDLEDHDHFTQTWTWQEKGKPRPTVFHFTRKKKG